MRLLIRLTGLAWLCAAVATADTGEWFFTFAVTSRTQLATLTPLVSIANVRGTTVVAYATAAQFARFQSLAMPYTLLPHPGTLFTPRMTDDPRAVQAKGAWDVYPTYGAYTSMMYGFAHDYPALCRVTNIGNSVNGRQLLCAILSDNVRTREDEPQVLYSAAMHGNETTGYMLLLRLIDYLLTNAGSVARASNIIANVELWINPLANPDGTYYGGNTTISGARRYNANGVELNRNFPDPEDGPHPDGHAWQPETEAMIRLATNQHFALSANFHGGAEVVNYPWDTWPRRHADDAWFIRIARAYADAAQSNSPAGYMTDQEDGIVNGWDWYEVNGGRQDYFTYFARGREVTIELSDYFVLPEAQFAAYWNYNRDALLGYIEESLRGVRGVVTGPLGAPLAALISIPGYDKDNSEIMTDPACGDFHRLLNAGTYHLRITAAGYPPVMVSNVLVTAGGCTRTNVVLVPEMGLGAVALGLTILLRKTILSHNHAQKERI
ncbi:MAG: M14 family zinc carboxypeptidase [bacterium]|nr:M14 family zinc carboxypeptidase [bacterium]